MALTSLFFNNVTYASGVLPNWVFSSTSIYAATQVGRGGTETILGDYEVYNITGTSLVTGATTTASASLDAFVATEKKLETTQAYIETMDEAELEELIAKLDAKVVLEEADMPHKEL